MPSISKVAKPKCNNMSMSWFLYSKFDRARINTAASGNVALFPNLNLAFNRVKKERKFYDYFYIARDKKRARHRGLIR